MNALAGQRVQVGRQRGDQRLAFARAHLGDLALVQHDPADELHVEVTHPQRALGGLAHCSKGLRQKVVELLATLQTRPQLIGYRP